MSAHSPFSPTLRIEEICTIRPGRADDANFILHSWVDAAFRMPLAKSVARSIHNRGHNALVKDILARRETQIRVAHVPDEDAAILGYAVYRLDPAIVYFVQVKKDARRNGIARALLGTLAGRAASYTHRPVIFGDLPIPSLWSYDPYLNWRI